jgi:hypothetical protein
VLLALAPRWFSARAGTTTGAMEAFRIARTARYAREVREIAS